MEEKKQPANEYSFANVTGTIWCNEREGRRPDYRVTFTVNYKTNRSKSMVLSVEGYTPLYLAENE